MENENVQLELVDLINAAKIMEHAIKLNVFTVEELVSVAPVVSKFIKFAHIVMHRVFAKTIKS